jgi:hypothetical protein
MRFRAMLELHGKTAQTRQRRLTKAIMMLDEGRG